MRRREEFGVVELAGFVAEAEEVGGDEGPVGGGLGEVDGDGCGIARECEGSEGGGCCGDDEVATIHGCHFRELDSIAGGCTVGIFAG